MIALISISFLGLMVLAGAFIGQSIILGFFGLLIIAAAVILMIGKLKLDMPIRVDTRRKYKSTEVIEGTIEIRSKKPLTGITNWTIDLRATLPRQRTPEYKHTITLECPADISAGERIVRNFSFAVPYWEDMDHRFKQDIANLIFTNMQLSYMWSIDASLQMDGIDRASMKSVRCFLQYRNKQ